MDNITTTQIETDIDNIIAEVEAMKFIGTNEHNLHLSQMIVEYIVELIQISP